MKKVDLENNYIRNDNKLTDSLYEEMLRRQLEIAGMRYLRKMQRRKRICDIIEKTIIVLMAAALLAYIFIPGGYGW